jgi:hypothetical protein
VDGTAIGPVREVLDPLEPLTPLNGVHQLLEGPLPLPPDHEVGVLEPLIGQETRVGAPHHHDAASGADLVGQPVGLGRGGGDRRDAHEIRGEHLRHLQRMNVLDVHAHLVAEIAHDGAEEHRA